jgi:hypothetical protein
MKRILAKAAVCLGLVLVLCSCASISVEDGTEHATQKMPEIIYVADFATDSSDFEVDRKGPELAEFKKNLQLMMKTAIAADLTDRLVPAAAVSKARQSGLKNAWLVRGQFIVAKQGSRLLRSAIGFGSGGTKLETKVEVYNLSEDSFRPFMTFTTEGGSGAEPGAIIAFTTDPLQLAIGGVTGAAHGLSEDTARTAREITAKFSDYMYHRGWISEDQWIKPKHESASGMW